MSDEERIGRLEQQVAQLYRHLGLQPDAGGDGSGAGGMDADIVALLNGGSKINAVKLYRERTGVGLKEALAAIEAWERRYSLG